MTLMTCLEMMTTMKQKLDPPKADLKFRVREAFRDSQNFAHYTVHLLISDLEEAKNRNPEEARIVGGVRSERNFVVKGGKRLDGECLFHGEDWAPFLEDYPYIFRPERLAYAQDGPNQGIIKLRFRWTSLDDRRGNSDWVEREFAVDEYKEIVRKQIQTSDGKHQA